MNLTYRREEAHGLEKHLVQPMLPHHLWHESAALKMTRERCESLTLNGKQSEFLNWHSTNSWVVAASRSDLSKFVVSDLKKYCDKQEGICVILSDDRKTPIKADYINAICAYVDVS